MRHSLHRRALYSIAAWLASRHEAVSCGGAATITAVVFSDRCLATPTRGRSVAAARDFAVWEILTRNALIPVSNLPSVRENAAGVRMQILRRPFEGLCHRMRWRTECSWCALGLWLQSLLRYSRNPSSARHARKTLSRHKRLRATGRGFLIPRRLSLRIYSTTSCTRS